jgi:hypothetical protein
MFFEKFFWAVCEDAPLHVAGLSNRNGFKLSYAEKEWRTAEYDSYCSSCSDSEATFWPIALLMCVALAIFAGLKLFPFPFWWILLAGGSVGLIVWFVTVALAGTVGCRMASEYHAAEHKSIMLLLRKLPATRDNFRRCTMLTRRCDSYGIVSAAFTVIYVLTIIGYCISGDFSTALMLFGIFVTSQFLCRISYRLSKSRSTKIIVMAELVIGFAFVRWLLPMLCEVLVVSEPRDEIANEAIRLVERIRADVPELRVDEQI